MKHFSILYTIILASFLLSSCYTLASDKGLMAWWDFDGTGNKVAIEKVSGSKDKITGYANRVEGVKGTALKFDGFTTNIVRKASEAPDLSDTFTIEARVALGAYPWNWCPIASQEKDEKAGYYFGVDSQGHVGMRLSVGGKWLECKSKNAPGLKVGLELRKWYYVVGVYDSASGITIYIDGKVAGRLPVKGKINFAPEMDLLIGRNHKKMTPTHPVRTWATYPSWYSFDGIMDEIKIYNRALSSEEINRSYRAHQPKSNPEFAPRKFPTVPETGRFGAFYTKLRYYEQWDALWRTGDYSDIAVQFDELPIKVIFWRGSRYSPC